MKKSTFVDGLNHVLICGGTTDEWYTTTESQWQTEIETLIRSVQGLGVRWLSIFPYGGDLTDQERDEICERLIVTTGGVRTSNRVIFVAEEGLMVVIETCADGQQRIVDAVGSLAARQKIDEAKLAATLGAPTSGEPDLILILGPANKLPPSLVWELAYSELVFLDVPWLRCEIGDIQMALGDFQRRDRRFGGIDS